MATTVLFAIAVSEEMAFVGLPVHLDCGPGSGVIVDWGYESTDHVRRQIVVNGRMQDNDGRFSADNQGLIINEVKTSDAGTYMCGRGNSVYQEIRLHVSRE